MICCSSTGTYRHNSIPRDAAWNPGDRDTPISLGVPAVTIGRGGIGANSHGPGEYWVNVDGHIAMQRALLLPSAGLADPLP